MMGLNAAVQALKKAEKLKEKVITSNDLLNDSEAWMWQQQLQSAYQQVLLLDLEYALDQKVEQELWNYGFKNYIGLLQNLVKDRKNPKRSEPQALLTWCLESASGFYLTLLQEICSRFDLDLTFRRNGTVYGGNEGTKVIGNGPVQPHKNSCSYICQHCLVHLGDIARYRNQNRQAESFYRHAVQLSPTSGQPYNQLALLDSSRGDRLGTVFHYVRSIAVRHLFPAASTNLARTLSKCAQEQINIDGRSRLSAQECVALFLKLHGLLHIGTADLSSCTSSIRLLTDTLTAQVATESFSSTKLTQMLAINLFALHQSRGGFIANDTEQTIRADEGVTRAVVLDLVAGSLCSILLPVYTLREGDTLLDYFALPTIKLTLDWIRIESRALTEPAFQSRPQMWPSLCRLLNGLQPTLALFTGSATHYATVPLPEDRELQGFLPLETALSGLRFGCEDSKIESSDLNKLRASRLLQFGEWLAKREELGFITSREEPDGTVVFEAASSNQAPSSELIRELEQLSLGPKHSPSPSDLSSGSGSGSAGGSAGGSGTASTPDHLIGQASPSPQLQSEVHELTLQTKGKRAGILKPQGSLEKSREKESRDSNAGNALTPIVVGRKARQNVAMQAIMRKGSGPSNRQSDSDTKQVSFKTPSPPSNPSDKKGTLPVSRPQAQRARAVPPSLTAFTVPPPSITNSFAPPEPHVLRPPCGPWLDGNQERNGMISGTFNNPPNVTHNGRINIGLDATGGVPTGPMGPVGPVGPVTPVAPVAPLSPMSCHLRSPDNCMGLPVHVNSSESPRPWWPAKLDQSSNSGQGFTPPAVSMFADQGGHLAGGSFQNKSPPGNQPVGPGATSHWGSTVRQHPQQGQGPFSSLMYQQPPEDQHQLRQQKDAFQPASNFSPYSLFSTNSWLAPGLRASPHQTSNNATSEATNQERPSSIGTPSVPTASLVASQSLWSGPGPSPLERLLEQQKLLREGPAPKGGT